MARNNLTVHYRRKRKGLTNYKKRLMLLLSKQPRLVVRRSLNNISAQIVEYSQDGDKVVASAHSSQLKKLGWNAHCGNIPAAYLTGLLLGKSAHSKKLSHAILDVGMHKPTPSSRVYAVLKGALDAGLDVPHSSEALPSDDRIQGVHIEKFAQSSQAKNLSKLFNECKQKIMK